MAHTILLLAFRLNLSRDLTDQAFSSGEAELLEHQGLIPLLPALLHSTVRHSVEDQAVKPDRPAGRRCRTERSGMRPAGSPAKRHAVALDQLFLDRQVEVGKGAQQP